MNDVFIVKTDQKTTAGTLRIYVYHKHNLVVVVAEHSTKSQHRARNLNNGGFEREMRKEMPTSPAALQL